ncbi:MAG: hypothetical protein ABFS14_03050 [Gemmatimonadota bacterium]
MLSLALPLAVFTQACGSGANPANAAGAGWTAVTDTVADTITVRTVSGQIWDSDAELVSELSIGVFDGAAEYQFGSLRALAVDPEGGMYVLDGHGPVLRAYAPDGTWLRDIGREGEGPGEYKRPDSGLAILPVGRLALRDPGNARISIYSLEGEYLESRPIAGSFNTGQKMVADNSGALLTPIVRNLGTSVFEWKRAMARYRADGTVDTLDTPDWEYEEAIISGESEGNSSTNNVPYTPEQVTAYSGQGYFVVGINEPFEGRYRFSLLKPAGPVLAIERDYKPASVDPAEASATRARLTANFRDNFPGWKWNGPDIPAVKPAYQRFVVGQDGRIWVLLHSPSEKYMDVAEQRAEEERLGRPVNPYREPVRFDVFEPSGEYLGEVSAPEGFAMYPRPVMRGDTVWAVVKDELDIARVHRFRLDFMTEAQP